MTRNIYKLPSHVELTVRRPDGAVETVRNDRLGSQINDTIFARIVRETKAAGRGDVLSYRNVTRDHVETDAEYAERMAGEAQDAAERKPQWQTDPRMGFAVGHDECVSHGSRREPSHKDD